VASPSESLGRRREGHLSDGKNGERALPLIGATGPTLGSRIGKAVDVSVTPQGDASARRAQPSDADELARLRWIWRAVERNEEGNPDRFRKEFAIWISEHDRTHVPFLVEVGGCAVGMAWLVIAERIPGPANWRRRSGDLQSVYVKAEHRDRGLGRFLVGTLIEGARQEGLVYLSVHPSPRSFPFYRRLGFTGDGSLLSLDLRRD
jgi:GNAT superfamily N-acetyltransferase